MATTDPHGHSHDDDHDHHHGHNHPHDPIEVTEGAGEYEIMVHAIKELLIEKGVITGEDIRKTLEFMDTRTPALGAKVVARAWTDPEFKKRLLANGTAAVAEMGIPMGDAELIVVENSKDVHNVIVCTLCSCYPRTVLGLPPDWYKSRNYRSRVVVEPRAVLKEFGTELPDSVSCAPTIPTPICATSCCPNAPPAPRAGRKSSWPPSSPATAWSALPFRRWARHP
jgi:thiocyanate hydrolase subunit gamma